MSYTLCRSVHVWCCWRLWRTFTRFAAGCVRGVRARRHAANRQQTHEHTRECGRSFVVSLNVLFSFIYFFFFIYSLSLSALHAASEQESPFIGSVFECKTCNRWMNRALAECDSRVSRENSKCCVYTMQYETRSALLYVIDCDLNFQRTCAPILPRSNRIEFIFAENRHYLIVRLFISSWRQRYVPKALFINTNAASLHATMPHIFADRRLAQNKMLCRHANSTECQRPPRQGSQPHSWLI